MIMINDMLLYLYAIKGGAQFFDYYFLERAPKIPHVIKYADKIRRNVFKL